MRPARLLSLVSCSLALAACGGDGGSVVLVDASPPDAVPVPPDAMPLDACGLTYCPSDLACTDTDTDEQHCGDCDTSCSGGTYCNGGTCECPPGFVPANPIIIGSQAITQIPGALIEFGAYPDLNGGLVADALAVGISIAPSGTPTTVGDPGYDLSGANPLTPPFIAAGYNVQLGGTFPTADAAVYATAGHVTFTKICDGGFEGVATGVTFSAVDSFTNPVIVPDGCSFDVPSLTFALGNACP